MIKLILFIGIFILSSCASVDAYKDLIEVTKDRFSTKVITNSDLDKFKKIKDKMIISIDDNDEFLVFFSSNSETWTSADKTFVIKNGKVTKTSGLKYDFEIFNYKGFKDFKKVKTFLEFKDPKSGYLDIEFTYSIINEGEYLLRISDKKVSYKLIKEDFIVEDISWKGSNYYWIDHNNNVILSKQIISPFNNKIRISK